MLLIGSETIKFYVNIKFYNCIAFVSTIANNKYIEFLKGDFIMAKSANLYARIEPEIKEQAEEILSALGIPASNAINMFYKQIILQRGLPFEVKMPIHPLDINGMTKEQIKVELQKGLDSIERGETEPAAKVFSALHKELGL